MPGTTVVVPSVLVTDRSTSGVSVSVSVAVLLLRSGSSVPIGAVTVAVVTRAPVADGSTSTWKKKMTFSPFARSTVVARASVPLVGAPTETLPLPPTKSHKAEATPAGSGTEMLAPVTGSTPLFVTTMV